MPMLQRLREDHAAALLAFRAGNRYFSLYISERGDEFFEQLAERLDDWPSEQKAGRPAYQGC